MGFCMSSSAQESEKIVVFSFLAWSTGDPFVCNTSCNIQGCKAFISEKTWKCIPNKKKLDYVRNEKYARIVIYVIKQASEIFFVLRFQY
jgi:hypothetical protein